MGTPEGVVVAFVITSYSSPLKLPLKIILPSLTPNDCEPYVGRDGEDISNFSVFFSL